MKRINLNSSPALAYIVGVYFGDAPLLQKSNHRYGIRLKVIDKDFAEAFAKALGEIGLNPSVGFEREKTRSNRWYVEAYGKGLFTFLKGPKERLFDVARAYPREFLRGFFDSEGTVGYSSNSAKSNLFVSAANYDLDVLELCSELLDELDIHSKIYLRSPKGTPVKIRGKWYEYKQDLYEIRVYRRKSVLNYYLQVGFTIQRRQQKLAQALYELGLLNEQTQTSIYKNGLVAGGGFEPPTSGL
ncbi:LAGLIDADG family homing endonuclease [Thermococcus peptonophilus]|uniref:LAGLIDADG family homing endonuclease n=1 Tax=Thermococcus peptonophilus TaxID=53952 RepID=UPI001E2EFB78|nr:LAGLIDADG family homing endonuclease [Thermococcus peptonophilus]